MKIESPRDSETLPLAPDSGRRSVPGGKLQVGCGRFPLPGWINIDTQALEGVDLVLDVRDGLPFRDLAVVFAEHFLEHLTLEEALGFLDECWEALAPGGKIRLSTPNLDWVWATHDPRDGSVANRTRKTLIANRAFYGWEHRFLWSGDLLEEALQASGFRGVRFCRYGESDFEALRGLERHERYDDSIELPHVLIVDAESGERDPRRRGELERLLHAEFLDHLRG